MGDARLHDLRHKGARQLTWSKGLKERYEVDQESNAELIERLDREAVPVLEVDPEAFRQIVDADLLPDFLEAVEIGGRAGGYRLARGVKSLRVQTS